MTCPRSQSQESSGAGIQTHWWSSSWAHALNHCALGGSQEGTHCGWLEELPRESVKSSPFPTGTFSCGKHDGGNDCWGLWWRRGNYSVTCTGHSPGETVSFWVCRDGLSRGLGHDSPWQQKWTKSDVIIQMHSPVSYHVSKASLPWQTPWRRNLCLYSTPTRARYTWGVQ